MPPHATLRAVQALPDGRLAAGSDYGMVLIAGDKVQPFPFPQGARREMRGVTALAVLGMVAGTWPHLMALSAAAQP